MREGRERREGKLGPTLHRKRSEAFIYLKPVGAEAPFADEKRRKDKMIRDLDRPRTLSSGIEILRAEDSELRLNLVAQFARDFQHNVHSACPGQSGYPQRAANAIYSLVLP